MEKIGIICEYNPFHNGHLYHINKIKELHPDSLIILCLNGYFLQRGEISILSKYDKTFLALENNVDIVIELPVLFGTQSADIFAYNSVYLLNELKVDKIIFGSESNNIEKIKEIVNIQDTKEYNEKIKVLLDKGINYPTAMAKALNIDFEFLPNDLLAISYVKAIDKINKNINGESILRTNNYLDNELESNIVSASNIREKLKNNKNIDKYVPNNVINFIKDIDTDLFFKLLKYKIVTCDNLDAYLDVDEGIEYRLKKYIKEVSSYEEYINIIKTKRYTYNKLNRMFIHILLNIKKEDAKEKLTYLKVLGFNKKGKNYLNSIKKYIDLSLKPDKNSKIYNIELNSSILYDLLTNSNCMEKELANKPIIY